MSTSEASREAPPRKEKALTIGAVTKQLEREFPDISISKIRYLEDQKLLAPRRTTGGYRLYSPAGIVPVPIFSGTSLLIRVVTFAPARHTFAPFTSSSFA